MRPRTLESSQIILAGNFTFDPIIIVMGQILASQIACYLHDLAYIDNPRFREIRFISAIRQLYLRGCS